MELRMMTLNLGGVGDGWFEGRRETLVQGIKELAPDLVLFQEVSSRGSPYPYDQVQDLSERLEMPYAAFSPYGNPDEIKSKERGGVALVANWPFRWVEILPLPPGPVLPDARVALLGTVMHPDGDVHVLGTHLSWELEATGPRVDQMECALTRVCDLGWDRTGKRFVLAGDLNAVENEPVIQHLTNRFVDSYRSQHPHEPGLTWTHANPLVWYRAPDRRLDYIFGGPGTEVVRADVVLDSLDEPASDHFGLYAHLRWP